MSQNVKTNKYHEISQKYGDPWIWGIYIMLVIISIIESYSASSREIVSEGLYMPLIKQCIYLAGGAVLVFLTLRVDYNNPKFLYLMVPVLALATVFSLIYVMKFGAVINGARRAMTIIPGILTIQPAEFAKLSIVTLLSYIFAKSQKNRDISTRGLVWAAFAVLIYGGLMIKSGLTNTLLLIAISGSMLLIGGASFKKIGILMVFFGIMFGVFVIIKSHNDRADEMFKDSQREMQVEMPAGAAGEDSVHVQEETKEVARSGTWKNRLKEWWYSRLCTVPSRPKTSRKCSRAWLKPMAAGAVSVWAGPASAAACHWHSVTTSSRLSSRRQDSSADCS